VAIEIPPNFREPRIGSREPIGQQLKSRRRDEANRGAALRQIANFEHSSPLEDTVFRTAALINGLHDVPDLRPRQGRVWRVKRLEMPPRKNASLRRERR